MPYKDDLLSPNPVSWFKFSNFQYLGAQTCLFWSRSPNQDYYLDISIQFVNNLNNKLFIVNIECLLISIVINIEQQTVLPDKYEDSNSL